MSEGRGCHVHLLDKTIINIRIQPSLTGKELFDLVASQLLLHEKDYFNLGWRDEELNVMIWLDHNSRVLDQPSIPRQGDLVIYFLVRHQVKDLRSLSELVTLRLFFYHALNQVTTGTLECHREDGVKLAAYALQILEGDLISKSTSRHYLDKMKLIPDKVIIAFGSDLELCTSRVVEFYATLKGQSQKAAILEYMGLVHLLPGFGVTHFDVKDKKSFPWRIGVSNDGIGFYFNTSFDPRNTYTWDECQGAVCSKNKITFAIHEQHASPSISHKKITERKDEKETWTATSPLYARHVVAFIDVTRRFVNIMKNGGIPKIQPLEALLQRVPSMHGGLPSRPASTSSNPTPVMSSPLLASSLPIILDTHRSSSAGDEEMLKLEEDDTLLFLEMRRDKLVSELARRKKELVRLQAQETAYLTEHQLVRMPSVSHSLTDKNESTSPTPDQSKSQRISLNDPSVGISFDNDSDISSSDDDYDDDDEDDNDSFTMLDDFADDGALPSSSTSDQKSVLSKRDSNDEIMRTKQLLGNFPLWTNPYGRTHLLSPGVDADNTQNSSTLDSTLKESSYLFNSDILSPGLSYRPPSLLSTSHLTPMAHTPPLSAHSPSPVFFPNSTDPSNLYPQTDNPDHHTVNKGAEEDGDDDGLQKFEAYAIKRAHELPDVPTHPTTNSNNHNNSKKDKFPSNTSEPIFEHEEQSPSRTESYMSSKIPISQLYHKQVSDSSQPESPVRHPSPPKAHHGASPPKPVPRQQKLPPPEVPKRTTSLSQRQPSNSAEGAPPNQSHNSEPMRSLIPVSKPRIKFPPPPTTHHPHDVVKYREMATSTPPPDLPLPAVPNTISSPPVTFLPATVVKERPVTALPSNGLSEASV